MATRNVNPPGTFTSPSGGSSTSAIFTIVIPSGSYSGGSWSVVIGSSTGGTSVDTITTPSETSTNTTFASHGNGTNISLGPVAVNATELTDINNYAGNPLGMNCIYSVYNGVTCTGIAVTLNLTLTASNNPSNSSLTVTQFLQQTDSMAQSFIAALGDGTTNGSGDSTLMLPAMSYTNFAGHVKGNSGDTLIYSTDVNLSGLYNVNGWITIATETINHRVLMTSYNSGTSTSYMVISPALQNNTTVTTGSTHYASPDWGFSAQARLLEQVIYTYSNYALTNALLPNVYDLQNYAPYQKVCQNAFRKAILGLKLACINAGASVGIPSINDVNSFASYYNTGVGGSFTSLCSPEFSILYNSTLNISLTPSNVYAPVVESFATYNAGTSTFTSKATVDRTRFAGTATLSVSGLAGGGSSGTTGTIYINVSGLSSNGTYVASDVWTAAINASMTSCQFTPGNQAKTVTAVLSVSSVPSFVNSGTLVFSGGLPSGRSSTSIPVVAS